jgi:hypothetical protein
VARDTSLDEFVDPPDRPETDPGPTGEGNGDDERDEDIDESPTVEPARPTYEWSRKGRPCARCGQTVTRRWRDGEEGAMVCDDCKEW